MGPFRFRFDVILPAVSFGKLLRSAAEHSLAHTLPDTCTEGKAAQIKNPWVPLASKTKDRNTRFYSLGNKLRGRGTQVKAWSQARGGEGLNLKAPFGPIANEH